MTGDVRKVTTIALKELIRKDPLCALYRKQDSLDPAGIHLIMMALPMVNVENVRQIVVDRVEVFAKMTNTEAPSTFMMEIPHHSYESLPRAVT